MGEMMKSMEGSREPDGEASEPAKLLKRYDEMISALRERGHKHPATVRRRKKAA
jgi:hypothetical protein